MNSSWDIIMQAIPILTEGFVVTLEITVISLIIALVIGLIIGLLNTSRSKILRGIGVSYVDFVRGTPLLVQIFMIYFSIPKSLNGKQVTTIIYSSAYPVVGDRVYHECSGG